MIQDSFDIFDDIFSCCQTYIYNTAEFKRMFMACQSQSSVLTDDEGIGARFNKIGIEKIRAAYAQKKVDELQLSKEQSTASVQ